MDQDFERGQQGTPLSHKRHQDLPWRGTFEVSSTRCSTTRTGQGNPAYRLIQDLVEATYVEVRIINQKPSPRDLVGMRPIVHDKDGCNHLTTKRSPILDMQIE